MSGVYAYIGRDPQDQYYTGTTHGCSCCSHRHDNLTVEQIEEHIDALKRALHGARLALRYTRRMNKAVLKAKEAQDVQEG